MCIRDRNEPDTLLEGLVTEVLEQGFVMEDIELGSVLLNVDETTVMDGILAEGDIEVGQYVFVEYDGRLTRSLPPQAHADRVGCYRLTGTVDLSLSMGILLTGDPTFGDVIIRVDGSMPHLYQGMPITVYYLSLIHIWTAPTCTMCPSASASIPAAWKRRFWPRRAA